MFLVKVGAAILNQTPLDWDGNEARCLEAIQQARHQGVGILCLPELCLTGYGCEDAFHAPGTHAMAWRQLQELLPHTTGMVVAFGMPLLHQGGLYNTAAVAADGKLLGFVAKQHLAGDGLHYEPRWFKAWPAGMRATHEAVDGHRYPIGDVGFDVGGVRLGFEICEDAWVAQRPGAALAARGADLILNPSASHFAFGKHRVRRRFVLEGSRAFGATYVYANLLGNEAGRTLFDGGALIATAGRLVAAGPRLGFHEVEVTSAVVDVEATRLARLRTASFKPVVGEEADASWVRAPFNHPALAVDAAFARGDRPLAAEPWDDPDHGASKAEEFARAEAMGLWDYMRKSRARGFVLSLSGGADSAAVACLIHLMARLALDDLGPEGVAKRLPQLPIAATLAAKAPGQTPTQALTHLLLLTAYQGTANSGPVTRAAAAAVAKAVGAEHHELEVEALVAGYRSMIEGAIGRPLAWDSDDVALQNIQARVRAPGIWFFANLRGALLLTTSNRSEAAVGYATMDGDTAGGLAPIAGIDKAYLREWLRWMQATGPLGLGPIPELSVVTVQPPTAELRPSEAAQTDESDLMPYPVLDAIERAAIRDKHGPVEAFQVLCARFGPTAHQPEGPRVYTEAELGAWVARFFRLWCQNQWKRERYAPAFHLDDENLDPKTWCRFPILSGGYARELADLEGLLKQGGLVRA